MLTNRSAPPATVTPVLIYPDVRAAVEWLQAAFGFEEKVRIGEGHRSQLAFGSDGAIVVADERRDKAAPSGGVVTHEIKLASTTSTRHSPAPARPARGCWKSWRRTSTASAPAPSRIRSATAGS